MNSHNTNGATITAQDQCLLTVNDEWQPCCYTNDVALCRTLSVAPFLLGLILLLAVILKKHLTKCINWVAKRQQPIKNFKPKIVLFSTKCLIVSTLIRALFLFGFESFISQKYYLYVLFKDTPLLFIVLSLNA